TQQRASYLSRSKTPSVYVSAQLGQGSGIVTMQGSGEQSCHIRWGDLTGIARRCFLHNNLNGFWDAFCAKAVLAEPLRRISPLTQLLEAFKSILCAEGRSHACFSVRGLGSVKGLDIR